MAARSPVEGCPLPQAAPLREQIARPRLRPELALSAQGFALGKGADAEVLDFNARAVWPVWLLEPCRFFLLPIPNHSLFYSSCGLITSVKVAKIVPVRLSVASCRLPASKQLLGLLKLFWSHIQFLSGRGRSKHVI